MVLLPEPDRPVNQRIAGSMSVQPHARRLVDQQALAVDIGGAAQAKVDHAGARRGVGEAVDENEGVRSRDSRA